MKKTIYAIWDNKAEEIIGTLMTLSHLAIAMRTFNEIVTGDDPNNQIKKYPADFDLIELGTIEGGAITPHLDRKQDTEGRWTTFATHSKIANAKELLAAINEINQAAENASRPQLHRAD